MVNVFPTFLPRIHFDRLARDANSLEELASVNNLQSSSLKSYLTFDPLTNAVEER